MIIEGVYVQGYMFLWGEGDKCLYDTELRVQGRLSDCLWDHKNHMFLQTHGIANRSKIRIILHTKAEGMPCSIRNSSQHILDHSSGNIWNSNIFVSANSNGTTTCRLVKHILHCDPSTKKLFTHQVDNCPQQKDMGSLVSPVPTIEQVDLSWLPHKRHNLPSFSYF